MNLWRTLLLRIISVCIVLPAIPGCQNDCGVDPDMIVWSSQDDVCVSVSIDPSAYAGINSDPYILQEALISGDSLKILVEYGGGCGEAAFGLLTDGYFKESYPVQLDLRLILKSMDPCDALVQRSLCFDLAELSEAYNNSYRTTGGTIILHLKDHVVTLEYNF
jgi:hypothetical protein